jgi:hypothetical protein
MLSVSGKVPVPHLGASFKHPENGAGAGSSLVLLLASLPRQDYLARAPLSPACP